MNIFANIVSLLGLKISFDYDGVLTVKEYADKAEQMVKDGFDVLIVTARLDSDMEEVYNKAQELGILKSNVHNTNLKDKWEELKRLGVDRHYDNSQEQVDKINENTNTKAIKV